MGAAGNSDSERIGSSRANRIRTGDLLLERETRTARLPYDPINAPDGT
jgi:hypothetical protein